MVVSLPGPNLRKMEKMKTNGCDFSLDIQSRKCIVAENLYSTATYL